MLKWKKAAAALSAAAVLATGAGCTIGSGTAYAMTIDGVQINAGIYIYYSYASYMELTQTLSSENSELDVDDDDVVKEQKMDGISTEEWIENKTLEYCQRYVAVQKKFDELELSLTDDETKEIDSSIETFWESNGDVYERNGISKNSVKSVLENSYMTNTVFLYYYDIDGEEGVTEDELKEYYEDNNARVRYLKFDLTDGNGEELDDSGKEDMMTMVKDYLTRLEDYSDDLDAMEDEMDAVESDYDAYVTSISEEAAAETATSATDEDGNEIAATTTEAETTTTEAETTATTAAAEDTDAEETTVVGESESAETTTAAEDETATSETTAASDSDETAESEETTTTTAPYANEAIIAKVTTSEGQDEEDVTYSPSKAVYDFIFNDAEIGVPEIVEDTDNNAYYIVLRRDITERMTDDDLWTDDQKTSVISSKYDDAFEDMLDDWTADQTVDKNDSAIKRYDAFDIDMTNSSSAAAGY